MTEYKVQLSVFEGPLDLLLYLIKKEEVDIYEVNLTKIATQFIEYVEMMRRLDLDVAGEFLVMAATLMYIKSRELLPVDQQAIVEEDEEQIDPRWDLIRQLVEYKKFKDMAAQLQGRETEMAGVYGRQPNQLELFDPDPRAGNQVSLFDLIQAVGTILKRFHETEPEGVISEDKWSVSEKVQLLVDLVQTHTVVKFSELFATARSRSEVIATFLAMLELTRLKKVWLHQSEVFGEIDITSAPPEAAMLPGEVPPDGPMQAELNFDSPPANPAAPAASETDSVSERVSVTARQPEPGEETAPRQRSETVEQMEPGSSSPEADPAPPPPVPEGSPTSPF